MTLRAVILGILGALFIAGFGYVDSQILRSTLMVGHFFPVVVFGGLVVLTIGVGASGVPPCRRRGDCDLLAKSAQECALGLDLSTKNAFGQKTVIVVACTLLAEKMFVG